MVNGKEEEGNKDQVEFEELSDTVERLSVFRHMNHNAN